MLTIGLAHYDPSAAAREASAAKAALGRWLVGIELVGATGVELQRLACHRTVHEDREHENPPGILDVLEPVEHLLDAAHHLKVIANRKRVELS